MSYFFTGFIAGLALIVAIGAQNAFVLRQGLRCEHVLPVIAVCALADALLILAGVAGLGAIIEAQPLALNIIRYAGAAFLLYHGVAALWRMLRPEQLVPTKDQSTSLKSALLTVVGFTFLNPHVYLDTVILLGALANQAGLGRWLFASGAVVASLLWFVSLGYGARLLAPVFARPKAWQICDGFIALVMLTLAITLLLTNP